MCVYVCLCVCVCVCVCMLACVLVAVYVPVNKTLLLHRGVIACSISALHKKGLVLFTGLTGIDTFRSVNWYVFG